VGRYRRLDVLGRDERGYLPLRKTDADRLFPVLSERPAQRAVVLTTPLPFGEGTAVCPDPRLWRAGMARLTHRAHLSETGLPSIRLQEARRRPPSTASPEG
jgi:DNA replication protein DnaC